MLYLSMNAKEQPQLGEGLREVLGIWEQQRERLNVKPCVQADDLCSA